MHLESKWKEWQALMKRGLLNLLYEALALPIARLLFELLSSSCNFGNRNCHRLNLRVSFEWDLDHNVDRHGTPSIDSCSIRNPKDVDEWEKETNVIMPSDVSPSLFKYLRTIVTMRHARFCVYCRRFIILGLNPLTSNAREDRMRPCSPLSVSLLQIRLGHRK